MNRKFSFAIAAPLAGLLVGCFGQQKLATVPNPSDYTACKAAVCQVEITVTACPASGKAQATVEPPNLLVQGTAGSGAKNIQFRLRPASSNYVFNGQGIAFDDAGAEFERDGVVSTPKMVMLKDNFTQYDKDFKYTVLLQDTSTGNVCTYDPYIRNGIS